MTVCWLRRVAFTRASDAADFWQRFSWGFKCIALVEQGCNNAIALSRVLSFGLCYVLALVGSGLLVRHSDGANYLALVQTLTTPIGTLLVTSAVYPRAVCDNAHGCWGCCRGAVLDAVRAHSTIVGPDVHGTELRAVYGGCGWARNLGLVLTRRVQTTTWFSLGGLCLMIPGIVYYNNEDKLPCGTGPEDDQDKAGDVESRLPNTDMHTTSNGHVGDADAGAPLLQ